MILLTDTCAVLQSPSIEDVQLKTLLMILDDDELNVSSETELFDAVVRWGRKVFFYFRRKSVKSVIFIFYFLRSAIGKRCPATKRI